MINPFWCVLSLFRGKQSHPKDGSPAKGDTPIDQPLFSEAIASSPHIPRCPGRPRRANPSPQEVAASPKSAAPSASPAGGRQGVGGAVKPRLAVEPVGFMHFVAQWCLFVLFFWGKGCPLKSTNNKGCPFLSHGHWASECKHPKRKPQLHVHVVLPSKAGFCFSLERWFPSFSLGEEASLNEGTPAAPL